MDTFTHHFCAFGHGGAIEYKHPTMWEDCEYILSLTLSLGYFLHLAPLYKVRLYLLNAALCAVQQVMGPAQGCYVMVGTFT